MRHDLLTVHLYFQSISLILFVQQVNFAQKVIIQDIGYTDKSFRVDAFGPQYIVNCGALHTEVPGKFCVAHATLLNASANKCSDMNFAAIPVHKKQCDEAHRELKPR